MRAASVPKQRIAKLMGISPGMIRRIAREPAEPAAPHSGTMPRQAGPELPSSVGRYGQVVADMLVAELRLKGLEVLRRLREHGYAGGKSALSALIRQLRSSAVRPVFRLEGLAGEFSDNDFGELQVAWAGGGHQRVLFFVSRLKHSRYSLVTSVPDQRAKDLDLRSPLRVGPTGMVTWETNLYSMSAEAIDFSATLHLFRDRVRIVAERFRPQHPRLRGRSCLERQELLELGPDA